jgi:hypothetical protein
VSPLPPPSRLAGYAVAVAGAAAHGAGGGVGWVGGLAMPKWILNGAPGTARRDILSKGGPGVGLGDIGNATHNTFWEVIGVRSIAMATTPGVCVPFCNGF